MNTEFVATMLAAKRLEAEALVLLLPPETRQAAAGAIRMCADAAVGLLNCSKATSNASQNTHPQKERGLRSISID